MSKILKNSGRTTSKVMGEPQKNITRTTLNQYENQTHYIKRTISKITHQKIAENSRKTVSKISRRTTPKIAEESTREPH